MLGPNTAPFPPLGNTNPSSTLDIAEIELQQELRSMFDLDTQTYLQTYLNLAQQLKPQTWTADIQELYRSVHTIKGGAVTVGADAILHVATVLEDLLSDLRHLNPAPPLEDGQLGQMLLEAGELLASSLQVVAIGEAARIAVQPIVERIQNLRQCIKQVYLPEWSEQQQLHQEFAEQGFDLVVLDLEMALEQMPLQGEVPTPTVEIAQQTLAQLFEIGTDLQFASGWTELLQYCDDLFTSQGVEVWRTEWFIYLKGLKDCARQGGQLVALTPATLAESPLSLPLQMEDSVLVELDWQEPLEFDQSIQLDFAALDQAIDTLELEVPGQFEQQAEHEVDFNLLNSIVDSLPTLTSASDELDITVSELLDKLELPDIDIPSLEEVDSAESTFTSILPSPAIPELQPDVVTSQSDRDAVRRSEVDDSRVQIPVPLGRLDQTSQHLVETLLAARASQGFFQNLRSQLLTLFALAQESVEHITTLRQIQDDYALLDTLKSMAHNSSQGPNLERYRRGYTTINRLLETSLRLSELGAEAEKVTLKTAGSLQSLDRNLLLLQRVVEDSRLVPFQTLSLRARAILRDLTIRYGKPAQLIVQGEQIELDVGTMRKLEPALLHLLRNAYDHGLESPAERIAQGKPAQGKITLSLQRRGNAFLLELRDDGGGIDAQVIQSKAQERQLPLLHTQTPAELLAVLCQPGFSSRSTVNEISGRGVGMDVVANQVASLGGQLSLETILGVGTTFKLRIPAPHLLVPCALLSAGDLTFAIPTENIITASLFANLNATQTTELNCLYSWTIQEATSVPGLDLLEYWQARAAKRPMPKTAIAVRVGDQSTQQGIWLLADDLLGQTDLLINSLPSPLVAPIGLLGMSLQIDGSLTPVLEVATIVEYLLTPTTAPESAIPASEAVQTSPDGDRTHFESPGQNISHQTRTILVVDDASLMRRRLEASLHAYGYTTQTCVDGQEAWNWLQSNPSPALVITDIEMPVMDGFTLIDRCRQVGMTLPIMVVTSRISEEWVKEARRLGASDYLNKGFSTPELINKVKILIEDSHAN